MPNRYDYDDSKYYYDSDSDTLRAYEGEGNDYTGDGEEMNSDGDDD